MRTIISVQRATCLMVTACLGQAPAAAWAGDFDVSQIYTIDAAHSYVGFAVKYMGFAKVRGRFSEFRGAVRFDETDVEGTSATVFIDVASLDTNHERRDRDLRSDEWFDAEQFPTMSFRSRRAVPKESGFDFVGELTIRDVTKEVRITMDEFSGVMRDVREDTQVIFVGHTTIDRKEFGVEGERWSKVKEGIAGVADEVEIELTVLGKRINAPNFRNWLGSAERPQGRIYETVTASGVSAGLEEFDSIRETDQRAIKPGTLNMVGNMLLKEGRVDDAIQVFTANIEAFPQAGALYDSLGEAYAVKGDIERAIESYRVALEKESQNVSAIEMLRHLGE